MLHTLTLGIVLVTGAYLVTLAAVALLTPPHAVGFLLAFAGSARAHYLELALRAVAGGAFVLHAPQMRYPGASAWFGWVLLLTTVALAAMPWRWHRAFARRAVPYAGRYPALLGAASLLLGGLVLVSALTGSAR